eukprot:bmy_20310T0
MNGRVGFEEDVPVASRGACPGACPPPRDVSRFSPACVGWGLRSMFPVSSQPSGPRSLAGGTQQEDGSPPPGALPRRKRRNLAEVGQSGSPRPPEHHFPPGIRANTEEPRPTPVKIPIEKFHSI